MPYRVDARLTGRRPFQEYAVVLSTVFGSLFALQLVNTPPSLSVLLPAWAVVGWSWLLFLSALISGIGPWWKERATGLILEQVGLLSLGMVVLFYTIVLFVVNGQDALLSAGLIGGFGASCLRLGHQIQQVLDQVHAVEKQQGRHKRQKERPMDMAQLIGVLAAAGMGGIIVAIINAVVNWRKLGAEATSILTTAAGGIVERLDKDNTNLRDQVDKLQNKLELLEAAQQLADRRERAAEMIQERWQWHMERWHRYSSRLADELRALGGMIENPPPMWPEPIKLEDVDLTP